MKRPVCVLIPIFVITVGCAIAQQSPVRVGVVAGASRATFPQAGVRPNLSTNDLVQRDTLVNYLNSRKPKAGQIKVDAVPLSTLDKNGILAEAQEKGCAYVAILDLSGADQQQPKAPAMVTYSIVKASDGQPIEGVPGFATAWASQEAQSVMSAIYSALLKAGPP
jgi:hypothetical protein